MRSNCTSWDHQMPAAKVPKTQRIQWAITATIQKNSACSQSFSIREWFRNSGLQSSFSGQSQAVNPPCGPNGGAKNGHTPLLTTKVITNACTLGHSGHGHKRGDKSPSQKPAPAPKTGWAQIQKSQLCKNPSSLQASQASKPKSKCKLRPNAKFNSWAK